MAERVLGPAGGVLVSLIILLSIAGALNGCFLTTPRIYFAQARDGLFFRAFGQVHPRFQTPAYAIAAQGIWAAVLVLPRTYDPTTHKYGNLYSNLLDYVISAALLFYILTIAGVFQLRRKLLAFAKDSRARAKSPGSK